ncbi:MAG: butyrate kinase [Clostridia bacterium]|nr:butyrate kinase [Clostridia bacterium]
MGQVESEIKVLVVNPGSTSTRVAIYHGRDQVYTDNIQHPARELAAFPCISDQLEYRKSAVAESLASSGYTASDFDAVVSRGGAVRPVSGGVYKIDEAVIDDVTHRPSTEHAANLGAVIAADIARTAGISAFLVDPISVDEFEPLARLSGLPELPRVSLLHALSIRATAKKAAERLDRKVADINVIVAHMGGGITVCPVKRGRMIDANGANDEGPLSPERSGSIAAKDLAEICFSGKYTERELIFRLTHASGLVAHLGTSDARTIEEMIESGDAHASLVVQAMCCQIAKEIGAMATVLSGDVDAIALTGGLAAWDRVVSDLTARCRFISQILVFPGENEMEALALGALGALLGTEEVKSYAAEAGKCQGEPGRRNGLC